MKSRNEEIQLMKKRVYKANLCLPSSGLIKLTWGNVSEVNRELEVVVIKPSGVSYDTMESEQMVVTDLEGNILEENSMKPSSDLATHILIYKAFSEVNAVVHTHSKYAVAWSQAGRELPVYGTTHADAFYGPIPVTRQLTQQEVEEAYEKNTGKVIIETFEKNKLNPSAMPGVLVQGHGPFTWGSEPAKAVENSIILDEICEMAFITELVMKDKISLPSYILDKHYYRKHGTNAYYGQ